MTGEANNSGKDEALSIKVKSDALRLLSVRPRSVAELEERLRLKKHPEEAIQETLRLLKTQGLLDDLKFAKFFANSRTHHRPLGRGRLEFELKKKGLSKQAVAGALAGLGDVDEKKTARDLVFGRFQKMTGLSDEKKKNRLFGFLKRRGFSNDVIFPVISELFKDSR